MSNRTILKAKNLLIEIETADDKIYTTLKITKASNQLVLKYIDDNGKAKNEVDDKIQDISVTELAKKEKRDYYKQLLQNKYSEIENLVILSGSGSSVGIGGDVQKGLTMNDLWNQLNSEKLEDLKVLIKEVYPNLINKKDEIIENGLDKDLEKLLSLAGMKRTVTPNAALSLAIKNTKEFIRDKCSLDLPNDAPHLEFLNKLLLRPQKSSRAKIFTLNYDTLFEQAASKEKYTIIDGFTFSSPRVFNGKYFDYDIVETKDNRQDKHDSTIAKLFYLFKMHGSLNWRKNKTTLEIEEHDQKTIDVDDAVMIFPQDSKYEYSYEQPYFEMMARFQQACRTPNTLLISIGFSFLDKHISSVILESLKQNPSLNLMVFTYPEVVDNSENAKLYQKELHAIADIQSKVTLVAEKFEDFVKEYPENIAHNRFDLLEELNEGLKKAQANGKK